MRLLLYLSTGRLVGRRRALLLLLLVLLLLLLHALGDDVRHGGPVRQERLQLVLVAEQLGRVVLEVVRQVWVTVQRVVRPGRGHGGHLQLFDLGLLQALGFGSPVLEPYFHLFASAKISKNTSQKYCIQCTKS